MILSTTDTQCRNGQLLQLRPGPFPILTSMQVPAACFSSIAACRAVIRLQDFARPDVYVHTASQVVSGGSAQSPNYTGGGATRAVRRFTSRRNEPQFARPEVHVTTDQFVVEDYRCVSHSCFRCGEGH